jgi:C-terminal processing protease CtpA/Prc
MSTILKSVAVVLGFLFMVVPAWGLDTKAKQLAAMESILSEIESHYGLIEQKERDFGVTIPGLRAKYSRLINEAKTLEEHYGYTPVAAREILPPNEFRQLMIGMNSEWRDGHTNLNRLSLDSWTVGLNTGMIDGKLYITAINPDLFQRNTGVNEARPGDEVIAVNGVPVEKIAQQRMMYSHYATYDSRLMDTMESILTPHGGGDRPVKEGDEVRVTLLRGGEQFDVYLNWINQWEYMVLRSRYPKHFYTERLKAQRQEVPVPYGWTGMVWSYFKQGLYSEQRSGSRLPVGTIIDVGALLNAEIDKVAAERAQGAGARAFEEANDDVQAAQNDPAPRNGGGDLFKVTRLQGYIVRYENKNIGVLRIPSYSGDIVNEIRWLREVIRRMEPAVDVLVLDVLSNAGGSVYMGTKVVSMLAGKEALRSIRANTRLTDTLLYKWAPDGLGSDLESGAPNNYAEDRINDLTYLEWKKKFEGGEKWTGMEPSFANVTNRSGHGVVVPDAVSFEKPLLVLNDNRSASGGDFIPAIIQSAGRALIMGDTSKGLGAPVYRAIDSMPGSEMSFRCPMAYCERLDKIPIENIGAVPDLPRPVTIDDLKDGFKSWSLDVLAVAVAVADNKSKADLKELLKSRVESRQKRGSNEEKIEPVRLVLKEFADSDLFKKADGELSSDVAADLGVAYRKLGAKLAEAGGQLTREQWHMLTLPLPRELVKRDQIMSSLWKKDAMIERLEQLNGMARWRSAPEQLVLTESLATALKQIPGDIRVADPCNLILNALE